MSDDFDELPQLPSLDDVPVAPSSSTAGVSGSGLRPSASLAAGLTPSGMGIDFRGIGRKVGRGAAWFGGLFLIFLISAWVSLPTRSIAWRISHEARKAGFNITIDDISIRPWGSATLEHVVWNFKPSRPGSTPVPFVVDEFNASFSVIKYLLLDTIDLEFEGQLDEGLITGAYYKGDESHFELAIDDLPLYGVPKLQEAVNAPVRGMFALGVDITAPNNEWAKSSGRLEVHCFACTIGDGETKLFVPKAKKGGMLSRGVTIPEMDLGTLDGVLEIVDGKAVAEEFGTESEDIIFRISGDIEFKDPIAKTRLNLLIKTFITPSLRERSEQVDLLFLTADAKVKMEPPDTGWLGVVIEGNFKHPRPRGVNSKSRQERLREKREEREAALEERRVERARKRAEAKAKQEAAKAAEGEDAGEEPEEVEEPERAELAPREHPIPPEVGVMREVEEEDEGGEEEGEGEGEGEEEGEGEGEGEEEGEGEDEEAAAGEDEEGGAGEGDDEEMPPPT